MCTLFGRKQRESKKVAEEGTMDRRRMEWHDPRIHLRLRNKEDRFGKQPAGGLPL